MIDRRHGRFIGLDEAEPIVERLPQLVELGLGGVWVSGAGAQGEALGKDGIDLSLVRGSRLERLVGTGYLAGCDRRDHTQEQHYRNQQTNGQYGQTPDEPQRELHQTAR